MNNWTKQLNKKLTQQKSIEQINYWTKNNWIKSNWTVTQLTKFPTEHYTIEQLLNCLLFSWLLFSNLISLYNTSVWFVVFGSKLGMLSRVRGNYYILQNSWLGSRHESCQGLEEIITYFRTHGLDQLWFGSRHESRQGGTASRNTILHCGLDQSMKVVKG